MVMRSMIDKIKTVEQLLDRTDNDMGKKLGSDLYYAIDSAGWFWRENYKKIYKYADYDGDSKFRWNGKIQTAIYQISFMVNGGERGLEHRTESYYTLRDIFFKIRSVCLKYDEIK